MADTPVQIHITCQRCGDEMELRDPAPGAPWTPDQYWVCRRCGRHFWSTYPSPTPGEGKPPAKAGGDAKPA